jgi:hypothetical protein
MTAPRFRWIIPPYAIPDIRAQGVERTRGDFVRIGRAFRPLWSCDRPNAAWFRRKDHFIYLPI